MEYLKSFVEDWIRTRFQGARCTLVVADDGSTDGTIEWLTEHLDLYGPRLIVLRNDGRGIARQTNSILDFISSMDDLPDAAFLCNDDIRFLKPGWDRAYYDAMLMSGYEHLVYFNPEWKEPSHSESSPRLEGLHSSCTAREAMGCFYTLTPALIGRLGYFDEASFPVRGHSHVDYTMRACRAEANDSSCLFDIVTSNEYIGMMLREGYKRTYRTLTVKERIETTSDAALGKREAVLLTEGRVYVPREW
jgi:glycosyltransferase involved in cell wall biosynthesis